MDQEDKDLHHPLTHTPHHMHVHNYTRIMKWRSKQEEEKKRGGEKEREEKRGEKKEEITYSRSQFKVPVYRLS